MTSFQPSPSLEKRISTEIVKQSLSDIHADAGEDKPAEEEQLQQEQQPLAMMTHTKRSPVISFHFMQPAPQRQLVSYFISSIYNYLVSG